MSVVRFDEVGRGREQEQREGTRIDIEQELMDGTKQDQRETRKKYERNKETAGNGHTPRTLIKRILGIGLEEEVLEADHDGVEVEHGLPVLAQDVEAHVALEVHVRVVDLRGEDSR